MTDNQIILAEAEKFVIYQCERGQVFAELAEQLLLNAARLGGNWRAVHVRAAAAFLLQDAAGAGDFGRVTQERVQMIRGEEGTELEEATDDQS